MVNAYRDDLDAAQQRADALERELDAVRTRNEALEQQLAATPANAQRLEAALERERSERERLQAAIEHERQLRERLEAERVQRDAQALVARAPQLTPAVARRSPAQSIAVSVSAVVIFCAALPPVVASVSFMIALVAIVAYALTHDDRTKSGRKKS